MWLAIDIGGTKTLFAAFTQAGELVNSVKVPTNHNYKSFMAGLLAEVAKLNHSSFNLACVAAPGLIDREKDIVVAFGNLPWRNVPLRVELQKILGCPVIVENDTKLGGLSEARLPKAKKYHRVLYVTISTGIGGAVIIDGILDPEFLDTEIGQLPVEIKGRLNTWEHFASGSAMVRRFGKQAKDITDKAVWKIITHDISIGLLDVIAVIQPDLVIIGGGAGSHFDKFEKPLKAALADYQNPLVNIPPIIKAKHPEEAVIYGCYEMMKDYQNGHHDNISHINHKDHKLG